MIYDVTQLQSMSDNLGWDYQLANNIDASDTVNWNAGAGFEPLGDHPDWGGTNIDASALKQALKGRESFVLSISDGEIGDWDSEKEEVRKLVEKNHYAHIQIGSGTEFTQDLESWDRPVFYVSSGEDLSKLMVDATRETYRRFTRL